MPDGTEEAVEPEPQGGPRPFWSGTISFGLVAVPVRLFPASRSEAIRLRMLGPSGAPVRRRYVCASDGRVLEEDDLVRGYEVKPGKYVVVEDDELERLAPEKTRDIDLKKFVSRDALDPVSVERPYFLVPAGDSTKAYRLLADVLEHTGLAGIATFVLRDKERLLAILGESGVLRAVTLRFSDEIRKPESIGLPKKRSAESAEVKALQKTIAMHTRTTLAAAELDDPDVEALRALVERKRRAGKSVVQSPVRETEEEGGETIDLLEALKRSMRGGGRPASHRHGPRASTSSSPSKARRRA